MKPLPLRQSLSKFGGGEGFRSVFVLLQKQAEVSVGLLGLGYFDFASYQPAAAGCYLGRPTFARFVFVVSW
jgi:hypothetical protein